MSRSGSTAVENAGRMGNTAKRYTSDSSDKPAQAKNTAHSLKVSGTEAVKHPKATIALHWGTVLALIVGVSAMFLREYVENKASRIELLELHRQLGMLVFAGVFLRLSVRYWIGLAKPVEAMSFFMRLCAGLCHLMLYALLLVLPLLGWAITNAHNTDLALFGLCNLPRLLADDPDLADELTDYHLWASWALLAVLLLHIGGALFHHYILKDKVLFAMLPGRQMHTQDARQK
ncbi:cytochrome b/b6 domain-containing protein [Methylomonas montana]|uniref:cytochrome b n=1 Tax=Methylomonas montana TaxID=3058963 RepID=UPI00265B09A7|nr:cytochrome b/b6 domain-containing protein [Methylomonas montana]WKJ89280.1 cytochrome b/b6 domain-containing protein [Methylomonas montana]